MDSASMNPYEEQLYTVFKTFDVDNEEALDKTAVLDLCDALQLEDRGATLVDTLFDRRSDRVTFTQFRNGLLSVLSGGERSPAPAVAPPPPAAAASHSDEDSSGREVAPKFVFGSKKYGRRSRPQRSTSVSGGSPRAASVSRLDSEENRIRSSQRMRCRRSASAMESRDLNTTDEDDAALAGFDHDRRIDCDQALALCRSLHMDGIDRGLVERIFDDSRGDETTVGEFFDRLNASLTSSIEVTRDPGPGDTFGDDGSDEDAGVAGELVVDAWERAGVPRPRRLLLELGFASAAVKPPDLERVLDDELAALPEPLGERRDPRSTLLTAALALGRLRTNRARRRADRTAAERDKLRADVAEANKRALLLAQDVDENHARMEAELAANLRRAEARHAETARRAADEAAAERERAAQARTRLEAEVGRRVEAEARARAQLDAERTRAERAEARAGAAEARAAAAEREAAKLADEVRAVAEGEPRGEEGAREGVAAELANRLDEARREAAALRDRNDELCALLEARRTEADKSARSAGDLSEELRSLIAPEPLEECDSSPTSMERRMIIDHQEATRRLQTILEIFRALSPTIDKKCDSCVAVESLVADISTRVHELGEAVIVEQQRSDAAVETDPVVPSLALAASVPTSQTQADLTEAPSSSNEVDTNIATQTDPITSDVSADNQGFEEALRNELAIVETKFEEEKQKYNDLIRELEASLEQMREEYERCEEYWSRKLGEERSAYDEERRAGDARLADLAARIENYERTFARPLPPIEERAALEAQVADLEAEFAEYRASAERSSRARDDELRRLRTRCVEMEARKAPQPRCACAAWAERCGRLGASLAALRGAGAREAAALRTRAARAEAALRRLHARLHAADLLVKDLYVENCHLAHRRAP